MRRPVPGNRIVSGLKRNAGAEREMHFKARMIADAHPNSPDTLTENEWEILRKSTSFLQFRIFKLFLKSLCAKDRLEEWVLGSRLMWFIEQSAIYLMQRREEDGILGDDSLTEQEKDVQLNKVYEAWVKVFSEETWQKYFDEHVKPEIEDMPAVAEQ